MLQARSRTFRSNTLYRDPAFGSILLCNFRIDCKEPRLSLTSYLLQRLSILLVDNKSIHGDQSLHVQIRMANKSEHTDSDSFVR